MLRQKQNEFIKSLTKYITAAEKFKAEKESFEAEKSLFETSADEFFNSFGKDSIEVPVVNALSPGIAYLVTRVQRTSITWDIKMLKEKLGRKLSKEVLTKRYEIIDFEGLVEYLKECNVDPNRFKSYLNVDESVNVRKLDELESLGKISKDQIEGCYLVDCSKPFYQVRKKRHATK